MRAEIDRLNDALHVDLDEGLAAPPFDVPAALDVRAKPSPLIDSAWGFAAGTRVLKASKAYEPSEHTT